MPDSPSLREHSVSVILANQHPSGAFIASPNFDVYRYSWFRDGAFIAEAMRVSDALDSAARFHAWAAAILNARLQQMQVLIDRARAGDVPGSDEHLHCRYHLDGSTSAEEWTNFQLDGFGTWLWALARHYVQDAPPEIQSAVRGLVPYLAEFWSTPSFDWWEESPGRVHVSSVGCICVGLEAIAKAQWVESPTREVATTAAQDIRRAIAAHGVHEGRLAKWFDGAGLDASALALVAPLQLISSSDPLARNTVDAVRAKLSSPGVHRHARDTYFGGGQWLLLTAMLGLCEVAEGEIDQALSLLHWIEAQADNGDLPEQVTTKTLHPEFEQPWIDQWGPIASPLLWSHAMYILLHDALEENR